MTHLRTPSLAWAIGLFTLGSAIAACQSDEAETAAYPNGGAADFCTAVAQAACKKNNTEANAVPAGCGVTVDTCVAAYAAHCEAGEIDPSRRSRDVANIYRPDRAKACIEAVRVGHEDGILYPTEIAAISQACDVVFSRRSPLNGPCSVEADCSDTATGSNKLSCFYDANGAGKCVVQTVVKPGFDCSALGSLCEAGYHCNGQNCIADTTGDQGDTSCARGGSCGTTQRCVPDPATPQGTVATNYVCIDKLQNDQDCAANEECVSGACALRLVDTPSGKVSKKQCVLDVRLNNPDAAACDIYQQ